MSAQVWTDWLENPGTGEFPGDCPVPEWAEDFDVYTKNGTAYAGSEADSWLWKLDLPYGGITHYRYAVPEDLAWLAKYVEYFPINYFMLTTAAYTGAPERVKTGNKYVERDWAKARRDLGYEQPPGADSQIPGAATPEEEEEWERQDRHRSDGSTAVYYELPEGATELQHLISYRNMNSQIGEIFRACYRYGQASHSDQLRDAKKIAFYAQAEVDRLEKWQ